MRRLMADPARRHRQSGVAVGVNRARGRYEYLDRRGRLYRFKSGDDFERGFARWLDAHGLTWEYEAHTYLLSNGRRYTPDFWIAEWATYVEVKGWPRGLDKVRVALADGHPILLLSGRNPVGLLAETFAEP